MRVIKPLTNEAESLNETATHDGSVEDQLLGLAVNQVIWEEKFNNIKIFQLGNSSYVFTIKFRKYHRII